MRVLCRHRLRVAVSAAALIHCQSALFAQDPNPHPEAPQAPTSGNVVHIDAPGEAESPTIVVTGSRISRPDLASNSPISVVTDTAFREQGQVNVEAVLNQLPQIAPGLTANVNNGGNGTATVDVRGLGPARTLVLVNGRRMVPATNVGIVDVNTIPSQLIERVDVVTGGASAVYGSDALSGVVNFVLKRDFEGLQVDAQERVTGHGDGNETTLAATLGVNAPDDRGNVTLSAAWTKRNAIFQGDRDFFRVDQVSAGSATGVAGRFDNSPFNPFATGGNRAFDQNGNPRAFVNTLDIDGGDRYNFAPVNYLQTPQTRLTLNALGRYEIADGVEAFVEANYTNNTTSLQLAPTPATNILVDPNSPVLTPAARALLAARANPAASAIFRRRLVEVGPRINTFDFDIYQINAGVRGNIGGGWNYELYYGYGQTKSTSSLENDVSRSRLIAGLNGCPVGSPAGCVPVNAFGAGNISPEAANFIRIGSSVDRFEFDRHNIVGTLSGSLVDLPAGPLGVSVGAEYRRDASSFDPSEPKRVGDLTGFNAQQAISGQFDVKEIFGEMRLPLLADRPFVDTLALEGRARLSDYSTVGSLFTFSVGGEYAPIRDVRFRAMYARASRAPSVFELFQAGDQNFPTVTDPCARITPTNAPRPAPSAAVATICQLQGLPDPRTTIFAQTNSQVEGRNVGNPNLGAEKSDTVTAGVVFRPTFLPGFDASVDWFSIKVDDYVSRAFGGSQGLVDACFASGVTTAAAYGADPACRLISRNASGDLMLTTPLANTGRLKTSGVDAQFGYRTNLGHFGSESGRLDLRANFTWTSSWQLDGTEYSGRSSYDFLTIPDWKSNVRLGYSVGPANFSINWNWIGDVTDESQADANGNELRIKDYHLFDASLRYMVDDRFEFSLGVNNVFDRQPPLILNGSGNTDTATYGGNGRTVFVGARMSL